MTSSKELLEIIASDINQIDLTHYTAINALSDIANSVIRVIDVLGKELFTTEEENI